MNMKCLKSIILLFISVFFISELTAQATYKPMPLNKNKTLKSIAFGSCSNQKKPQEMWQHVIENRPHLWVWLGDIIYADTENMSRMAADYDKQKKDVAYQKLLSRCPAIGIWDDHDFGVNDGNKTYPKKKESKELLLNFLDVPKDAAVRGREGGYQAFNFGPKGNRVKIILLDGRYFRDKLQKAPDGNANRYLPNPTGDMLGEAQWKWLENQLSNSDANINIIASGVQVIPTQHGFEKWGNFPKARQRLFDLISKTQPQNPLLISGDRHMAEISKIELKDLSCPLYEITSSGLTHSWSQKRPEPNQFRAGDLVIEKNFAILKIDWDAVPIKMSVEIRGLENELFLTQEIEGQ